MPKPKRTRPERETLLVMAPAAARGIAYEWYLRGFEESGFSFHGEIPNLTSNRALRRLLSRRFTKLWQDRHKV